MNCDYTLRELRTKYRTDFVDYFSYISLSTSLIEEDTGLITALSPTSHYESIQVLKGTLKASLNRRKDKKEIMGLAAAQVGIPVHAAYLEYINALGTLTDVLLINPNIEPSRTKSSKPPSLFLKLIKCPSSPCSYHIGLFNQNIIIKSSNHKPFIIKVGEKGDLYGEISANIQRIIWADKGYIPGDMEQLPMNYFKVAATLEESKKLKNSFDCFIHKDEIKTIISKYKIVDAMGYHKDGVKYLHQNLINLLSANITKEWIKIPNINMFKNLNNKILVT